MLSMAVQHGVNGALAHSSFPPQELGLNSLTASIFVKPKASSLHLSTLKFKKRINRRELSLSVSAAATETVAEETSTEDPNPATSQASEAINEKEKLGVVLKAMEKPRLVLKFIWMEKNIGITLDQVIQGHGTIPLSPYYFWPRKDAWEKLKSKLKSSNRSLRVSHGFHRRE